MFLVCSFTVPLMTGVTRFSRIDNIEPSLSHHVRINFLDEQDNMGVILTDNSHHSHYEFIIIKFRDQLDGLH